MKPEDIARERARWRYVGDERPPWALEPGPGEESVWDYPRPPRIERVAERLRVELAGEVVADTTSAWRVAETAAPPTYYIPMQDLRQELLVSEPGSSYCEWKGRAAYFSLQVGDRRAKQCAWCYPTPDEDYTALRDHVAFNASRVDACYVGDARVTPQPGEYYGGWITPGVVGPFKGERGSEGW